jgi:transmembrane sensor
MADYRDFEVDDFLKDHTFQRWVWENSPQDAAFWEQWFRQNPDRSDVLTQAKLMAVALQLRFQSPVSDQAIAHGIAELIHKREQSDRTGPAVYRPDNQPSSSGVWYRNPLWQLAATVVLVLGLGWWFWNEQQSYRSGTYQELVSQTGLPLTEKINTTTQPLSLPLSDGSVVTLAPNSKLSYPTAFEKDSRRVFLSGEAFFEVKKNPSKPFLVYANDAVTKVLGTSFRVKAYENDQIVRVEVRTGRVSVYAKTAFEKLGKDLPEVPGVVLTPNQQVIVNRLDGRLEKGLVQVPVILDQVSQPRELTIEEMPVPELLKLLEKMYGIDIMFDSGLMKNCIITTTFAEETLQERLSIICEAIGGSYEIIGGQVIVSSKGCKSE